MCGTLLHHRTNLLLLYQSPSRQTTCFDQCSTCTPVWRIPSAQAAFRWAGDGDITPGTAMIAAVTAAPAYVCYICHLEWRANGDSQIIESIAAVARESDIRCTVGDHQRETHTQRDRERERHRETHTERDAGTQRETQRETQSDTPERSPVEASIPPLASPKQMKLACRRCSRCQ